MSIALGMHCKLCERITHNLLERELERVILDDFALYLSELVSHMSGKICHVSANLTTSGRTIAVRLYGHTVNYECEQCICVIYTKEGIPALISAHTKINVHADKCGEEHVPHKWTVLALSGGYTKDSLDCIKSHLVSGARDINTLLSHHEEF